MGTTYQNRLCFDLDGRDRGRGVRGGNFSWPTAQHMANAALFRLCKMNDSLYTAHMPLTHKRGKGYLIVMYTVLVEGQTLSTHH